MTVRIDMGQNSSFPIFQVLNINLFKKVLQLKTPEIGQGLGRIQSCGARKPEQI